MKVFVTGGGGFFGSHLVETLLRDGNQVTAMLRYSSRPNLGNLEHLLKEYSESKLKLVFGDIRDTYWLNNAVSDHEAVVHLAALISIPESYSAPLSYLEVNAQGTLNVLESGRINKVNRILITSTSEVYGTAQTEKISESHPLNPQSPYAASKVAADSLALAYSKSFNTPVTILRPFNLFGPRQSSRAVIPTIIQQLLSDTEFLKLGDISTSREFNFVTDTAEAYLKALTSNVVDGKVLNLGNEFELTLKEVIEILFEITGLTKEIRVDPGKIRPKDSEVLRLRSNSSEAQKILNWKPNCCSKETFISSLRSTVEWYKSSPTKKSKLWNQVEGTLK